MRARLSVTILAAALAASACKSERHAGPATPPTPAAGDASVAIAPPTTAPAPAPGGVIAKPFLWKAEKKGKAAFLFGTVHLGIDAESALPPWVWLRFDQAKSFAMETDINDPSLMTAVMRTDGKTLDKELGAEYWEKLEAVLGKILADNVKGFKASAAATLVAVQGLPMTLPMDLVLKQKAERGGKQIVYLEEAQKQQALLDKWMDVRMLRFLLDDIENQKKRNKDLVAAYRAGDEKAVVDLGDESVLEEAGLSRAERDQSMKEMLYDRNAAWVPAIEKMIADGGGFIAVGAMHLVGDRSVLKLLEDKGYEISRVTGP